MRLIKALIGGLIGAALSVAVLVGLGLYVLDGTPPMWLAIVAGVITGLGVRLLGKSDKPGPCYACGAIAALLTMAAVYASTEGFRVAVEAENEKTSKSSPLAGAGEPATPPEAEMPEGGESVEGEEESGAEETATEEPAGEESTEEPAEDEAATTDEPAGDEEPAGEEVVVEEETEVVAPQPAADAVVPRVNVGARPPQDPDFSIIDYVFIAVGALVAYELGRSCGCSKPVA